MSPAFFFDEPIGGAAESAGTHVADTSEDFARVVRLARHGLRASGAWICLSDGTCYPPDPPAVVQALCRRAAEAGGSCWTADGSREPALATEASDRFFAAAGMVDCSRKPVGTLCVVGTEPRESEEADRQVLGDLAELAAQVVRARCQAETVARLQESLSARRAVEKLKDEFLSVVSHELRTPLTSIRGSLGLLAKGVLGDLPEKAQRMVDIAVSNTDRLVRLINDILDLERIESGKIELEKRVCSGRELIRLAVEAMQPIADKSGVEVLVEVEDVSVHVDADRITQTLTNLLSNAIKFSSKEGTVHVGVRRDDSRAVFSVRDQGRGIPAGKHETIFERFQQVNASDSRDKGGTGLGLAICRSIVAQHGGRLWVESEVDQGSTFLFTVDAVALPRPLPDDMPESPLVLVCDDDRDVRRLLSSLLRRCNYRVATVSSGEDLLEKLPVVRPDVILLDLVMPGMGGRDALAALRRRDDSRSVPVVIVSGVATDITEAQEMGVSDWVEKPFEKRHLLGAVQRALGRGPVAVRVVVVEDDADLGAVIVAALERHNVDAFIAGTGGQAIQLCQKLLPDLVVLDLGLPDMDGTFVLEWMRGRKPLDETPVIIYSNRDLSESEREAMRLGETHFLTKCRVTLADFEEQVLRILQQTSPRTRIGVGALAGFDRRGSGA